MAKKLEPPKGFEDLEIRKRAGQSIVRMLDAYESDGDRVFAFSRYDLARDTYDDLKAPSKLQIDPGIDSYQLPLLHRGVNLASSYVAESLTMLEDWFLFDHGPEETSALREARQADTQMLLDRGDFAIAVRQIAFNSVMYNRGPFRVRYRVVESLDSSKDMLVCLPVVEPWEPKDFVWYPLSARTWDAARMIGGYLRMSVREIRRRQKDGEFFEDVFVASSDNEDKTQTAYVADEAPRLFIGMAWLPGDDDTAVQSDIDNEIEYACYRVTLLYQSGELLSLEKYDLPCPEWFCPSPNPDPERIWARNSLATRLLELQAIYNDNYTTQILGAIAGAKQTVYGSNVAKGSMATETMPVGGFISTPGDARFWSPPSAYHSGQALMEQARAVSNMADGAIRVSETGAGSLPPTSTTATATSAALAGQLAGTKDYRLTMCGPLEDAVELVQVLVRKHFSAVKKVYGDMMRTTSAAEWKQKFEIQINGRSPTNDPRNLVDKIGQLLQVAQLTGVQILNDGTVIKGGALFEQTAGALEVPFGLEGIIVKPPPMPAVGEGNVGTDANGNPAGEPAPPDLAAAIEGLLGSGFDPSAFGGDEGMVSPGAGGLDGPVM